MGEFADSPLNGAISPSALGPNGSDLPAGDAPLTPVALSWSRYDTVFLILVGALSSTILFKIASVQYLEILYLVQIAILLASFARRGYVVVWFRPFLRIGLFWAVFCLGAISLGIAALRLEFYLPADLPLLKRPLLITLSRVVELVGNVSAMVYLAHSFRSHPDKLRFTLRVYFWTGFASAVYSLLSWPIASAGIAYYGAYSSTHRFRGFYNEGGPYGLYVLSVLLVGFALFRQSWEVRSRLYWAIPLLVLTFFMSYSKAGGVAVLLLGLVNAVFARSVTKRLAVTGAVLLLLAVLSATVDLSRSIRQIKATSEAYERMSHAHIGDGNFMYGRIAGAFIAPRMLQAHPLAGVGWGNYGTLRNAPEFRGAAAWADESDEPGLGFAGYAPELGLPLFGFAFVCLLLPFVYLRRVRAPVYLQNLALLQPMVHLCGAQFNLTYPWVVTSFALGLGWMWHRNSRAHGMAALNPQPSVLIAATHASGL